MKKYKLLSGISGLLSGVLAIVAGAAFLIFLQSGGVEDGGQALGLVLLSLFIIPALIIEAILAVVILGLSIGVLASKNLSKGLFVAAGVLEIIAGAGLAILSLLIYSFTIVLAVFLIAATVCIVAAIITFVAKGKILKIAE